MPRAPVARDAPAGRRVPGGFQHAARSTRPPPPAPAESRTSESVRSLDDLRALGAVEAYQRIRVREGRAATLNLLYALHATLEGKRWTEVTAAEKARLKRALH